MVKKTEYFELLAMAVFEVSQLIEKGKDEWNSSYPTVTC